MLPTPAAQRCHRRARLRCQAARLKGVQLRRKLSSALDGRGWGCRAVGARRAFLRGIEDVEGVYELVAKPRDSGDGKREGRTRPSGKASCLEEPQLRRLLRTSVTGSRRPDGKLDVRYVTAVGHVEARAAHPRFKVVQFGQHLGLQLAITDPFAQTAKLPRHPTPRGPPADEGRAKDSAAQNPRRLRSGSSLDGTHLGNFGSSNDGNGAASGNGWAVKRLVRCGSDTHRAPTWTESITTVGTPRMSGGKILITLLLRMGSCGNGSKRAALQPGVTWCAWLTNTIQHAGGTGSCRMGDLIVRFALPANAVSTTQGQAEAASCTALRLRACWINCVTRELAVSSDIVAGTLLLASAVFEVGVSALRSVSVCCAPLSTRTRQRSFRRRCGPSEERAAALPRQLWDAIQRTTSASPSNEYIPEQHTVDDPRLTPP